MSEHPANAIDWIRAEYQSRRENNQQYSLRAFAKRLDIPVGRLSEILGRKRRLTERAAHKIADRLEYTPELRKRFLGAMKKPSQDKTPYQELAADAFHLIADWYHYGILNLTEVSDFESDFKKMSRRLGVSVVELRSAVERLQRLGLLEVKKGHLMRTSQRLTTSVDIPTPAIRKSHRARLQMAIDALEGVPVDERDFSSIMFPASEEFLREAKPHIEEFRRSMLALAQKFKKDDVYSLTVQLFPISKRG